MVIFQMVNSLSLRLPDLPDAKSARPVRVCVRVIW